jgi:M6 family metalloprotease-like protein
MVLSPPWFTLAGDVLGLTILVDFSDVPGTVLTQAQIDDYCNKPNYTNFSNAGSIYDYFFIQSGGNLRYNNNVTYYVRVPQPKTYYNDTSVPDNCGTCGRLLLNDALNVLIANGYDFSQLTTKSGGCFHRRKVWVAASIFTITRSPI